MVGLPCFIAVVLAHRLGVKALPAVFAVGGVDPVGTTVGVGYRRFRVKVFRCRRGAFAADGHAVVVVVPAGKERRRNEFIITDTSEYVYIYREKGA